MVAHESGLSHPAAALGLRARRIVSEDSIHSIASLSTAIHPFPESKNLTVVLVAEASAGEDAHRAPPQAEVPGLRPNERVPLEEGHDAAAEVGEAIDLPVPAAVPGSARGAAAQRLPEQIERCPIVLRDVERCGNSPATMARLPIAANDP